MTRQLTISLPDKPTREQELLYEAISREMAKQTTASESMRSLIVARFVESFDFSNSAAQHKSAGGWAQYLISIYKLETTPEYKQ